MTNSEMIAKVIAKIESIPGYNYDPAIVATIINAGILPDGTVFASSPKGAMTAYVDRFDLVKDGKVVMSMPMSDKAREESLMIHAQFASRKGHAMGGF